MLSKGDSFPFNLSPFKGVAKKGADCWHNSLLPYFLNWTFTKIYCSIFFFACFSFLLNILPASLLQFVVCLTLMAKEMILSYTKSWQCQPMLTNLFPSQSGGIHKSNVKLQAYKDPLLLLLLLLLFSTRTESKSLSSWFQRKFIMIRAPTWSGAETSSSQWQAKPCFTFQ